MQLTVNGDTVVSSNIIIAKLVQGPIVLRSTTPVGTTAPKVVLTGYNFGSFATSQLSFGFNSGAQLGVDFTIDECHECTQV